MQASKVGTPRAHESLLQLRVLAAVLLAAPTLLWAQADLQVRAFLATQNPNIVGGAFELRIVLENVGDQETQFGVGNVALRVDLSPLGDYVRVDQGSVSQGAINECGITDNVLECVEVSDKYLPGGSSSVSIDGFFSGVGTWTLPADSGACSVDPDDVVAEGNEDNNGCDGLLDAVLVNAAPVVEADRLLGVSMWTNLLYSYSLAEERFIDVRAIDEVDGTPIHALNDIAAEPGSGDLFVFHRRYLSVTHRLGRLDPDVGVTDVGETGVSFHDSAFSSDGTLYAVGRDATLYQVDTTTAGVTPLCDTSFGSGNSRHSALAWSESAQSLVQVVNAPEGDIRTIDPSMFPVDPADPCPVTDIAPMDPAVRSGIFAAEFIGGELLVVEENEELNVLGDQATAAVLTELPADFHGFVVDPDPADKQASTCPPSAVIGVSPDGNGTILFATDPYGGGLEFLTSTRGLLDAIDLIPGETELFASDTPSFRETEYLRIDSCTGETLSTVPADLRFFRAADVDPDGVVRAYEPGRGPGGRAGLFELDPETGAETQLGGDGPSARGMAVIGDEVVHDDGIATDPREIRFHDLAAYPALNSTLALDFDESLGGNVGPFRKGDRQNERTIEALDVTPFGDLLALLERVPESGGSNQATFQPSMLVRIAEDGRVTPIARVPAGTALLAVDATAPRPDFMFRSSFEADEGDE